MRTWMILYKVGKDIDGKVIFAKNFDAAIYKFWEHNHDAEIKAVFEVAR